MRGRLPLGFLLAAALVVAVGAAGVIWAMGSGSQSVGDTARFVPADAAFYATVNTDPASRQWVQMSQLLGRLGLEDQLRTARDEGLSGAGVGWDAEIAPFLGGEATLAITRLDGSRPDGYVILATRDGEKAWDHAVTVLDERAARDSVRPGSRSYRGSTIRSYHEGGAVGSLWVTRKDRYLIFGLEDAQAETVLDLAAGKGETLAGLDRFRTARSAVTDDSLLFVYLDPGAVGDAATGLAGAFTDSALLGTLDSGALRGTALAFAASAERTGIRLEWQSVGIDPASNPIALTSAPDTSRFAQRAPADSLLFVAGKDFYGSFVRGVMEMMNQAARDPDAAGFSAELKGALDDLTRQTGVDVDRDLLAHLTGEYAVAAGAGSVTPDDFWLLAMSAVRDAGTVGRSLSALDDYGRREGRQVTRSTAGSAAIVESRGSGDMDSYAYTITGDDLIVGLSAESVRGTLGKGNVLAGNADYRESLTLLPGGRSLTVFVNLARIITLARDEIEESAGDFLQWESLERLRYLALATTQKDDRIGGVLFLRVSSE